jgi:hypothetical protein
VAERRDLDVAQLKKALKGAARPYCTISPTRDDSADFVIYYTSANRQIEIFDSRSLPVLSETLQDLLSANRSVDPESIAEVSADVALTISDMLQSSSPRSQITEIQAAAYGVVTDFVIACVACLARYRRHYVPISSIPHAQLAEALSAHNRSSLVRIFRSSLGLAPYADQSGDQRLTPIPRAFIASPLTNLNDAAHQVVLDDARSVRRLLNSLGMTVITPSPDLTPSKTTDEMADALYSLERLLITGSDLVVAVGAEHDSWGISRTVTWAEASGSITIVISERRILSRILDGTSHHTYRPDIEKEPEGQISSLRNLINEMLPLIYSHAGDRVAICSRLRQPVAEGRRRLERLDEKAFERSFLARKRALELLKHPIMIDHASHIEGRALRQLLGSRLDPMLSVLGGAPTYPPGGRVSQPSTNGLSPQSFANLQSAAQVEGWTDAEVLRLISEYLTTRPRAGYAYRNSMVSGSDWKQLYGRIFGPGR